MTAKTKNWPTEAPGLIKAAMDAKSISQGQLSKVTGIAQSNISAFLAGHRGMSAKNLKLIADFLGLSVDDLLGGPKSRKALQVVEIAPEPATWDGHSMPAALPPGLRDFLQRRTTELNITVRERFYLATMRFSAEPWVSFDDQFWTEVLTFWRRVLAEQDARSAAQPLPASQETPPEPD